MDTTAIAANLARVRAAIGAVAARAGRPPGDVRLIAVSKTRSPADVAAAVAAGQRVFGENTVQDALTKIPQFAGAGLEWHFIGHLQSNKARFLPGYFQWLHSLDSASLAARVARFAHAQAAVIDALIEVNIAGDPRKHGVTPAQLRPLVDEVLKLNLSGLRLRGLMTIGPHPADEHELRRAFAAVRQLRDDCAREFALPGFSELSMGMSGDFAEAILEGSTMVRIGTAIFGERAYSSP
jgi:hypothetical protein